MEMDYKSKREVTGELRAAIVLQAFEDYRDHIVNIEIGGLIPDHRSIEAVRLYAKNSKTMSPREKSNLRNWVDRSKESLDAYESAERFFKHSWHDNISLYDISGEEMLEKAREKAQEIIEAHYEKIKTEKKEKIRKNNEKQRERRRNLNGSCNLVLDS